MALIPRPVRWPPNSKSAERSDFQLFDGDVFAGRICQTPGPDSPKWFWTLCVEVGEGVHVPSGLADTLEDAQAQFLAAWNEAKKTDDLPESAPEAG